MEDTVLIDVSRSRHLSDLGYRNALPLATPMLTSAHKEIMDGQYYTEILEQHIPEIKSTLNVIKFVYDVLTDYYYTAQGDGLKFAYTTCENLSYKKLIETDW